MAKWYKGRNRRRRQLRDYAIQLEMMSENNSDYEYEDFIEVMYKVHSAARRLPEGDYAQVYINRINEVMGYMDMVWYREQVEQDYWS